MMHPMESPNGVHSATAISGRWVRLRPVSRADYPALYEWRLDTQMVHLWNISRRWPPYEEFVAGLEQTLLKSTMLAVIDKMTDRLVGYCQSYGDSPWDRWAYVAAYLVPKYRVRPHFPEAVLLCLEALFKWYPLNKVYIEAYEFAENLHQMLPVLGFVEEGTTPDHFWHGDRYWGLTRYALYRERWPEGRDRLVDILRIRDKLEEPSAVE